MLSRKQQLRHLCRRRRDHVDWYTASYNKRWVAGDTRVNYHQNQSLGSTFSCSQYEALQGVNHLRQEPRKPAHRPCGRDVKLQDFETLPASSSTSDCSATNSKRCVRFDECIRVVLIPTRRELKMLNGGIGQGLWWSVQDCLEFKKSVRTRVFALGLTTQPNILDPDIATLLADSDEEEDDVPPNATKFSRTAPGHIVPSSTTTVPPKVAEHRVHGTCQSCPPAVLLPAADVAA